MARLDVLFVPNNNLCYHISDRNHSSNCHISDALKSALHTIPYILATHRCGDGFLLYSVWIFIGYNDICEQIFLDKNKTQNSPSIKSFLYFCICKSTIRKDAGVVDRDGLENRCTGNCTQGSNPCLSASQLNNKDTQKMRVSFFSMVNLFIVYLIYLQYVSLMYCG